MKSCGWTLDIVHPQVLVKAFSSKLPWLGYAINHAIFSHHDNSRWDACRRQPKIEAGQQELV